MVGNSQEKCNSLAHFFIEKMNDIQLDILSIPGFTPDTSDTPVTPLLTHFNLVSTKEVLKLMAAMKSTSSAADQVPAAFIKQHAEAFAVVYRDIINASLRMGMFPDSLKEAVVTPLVKKPFLDPDVLANNRPI